MEMYYKILTYIILVGICLLVYLSWKIYDSVDTNSTSTLKLLVNREWFMCDTQLPAISDEYLVLQKILGHHTVKRVVAYSTNLYEVDHEDFEYCKHIGGWYAWDSNCGYYIVNDIYAWMPIPPSPKIERKDI